MPIQTPSVTERFTAAPVPKRLAVLGSTGSIGRQTLDIVRHRPEKFRAVVLSTNTRWELLAQQAAEFLPDYAVVADERFAEPLRRALAHLPVRVLAGSGELARVTAGCDADTVVNALVGFAGLPPTVAALEAGKTLALANKESLVVAGEYVMELARRKGVEVVPIDSEHSAILQCLTGESSPVRKIILTASGGPFRRLPAGELENVTVEQALAHPKWEMGAKITIDSATMLNKGFEVIEARWLFGLGASQIEVAVHPQAVVHSLVEFADGALKAQLGTPDMHLPIQYALTYPERWEMPSDEGFSLTRCRELSFEEPDTEKFPALGIAYDVLESGGDRGCVLNAANEEAVQAFLAGRIRFTDIARVITHCLDRIPYGELPDMETARECNALARRTAADYIAGLQGR
ncbi:MAG: 1-deoxy-D-xylulose-5-phosphate reductoisomerase [Alistipes sp.]|nr:1-deoxy-D-xylulose-5-phosphate reductoisomerase [Alistipes sp.]